MKLSNFRDYKEWSTPNSLIGRDHYRSATVDVERGVLWWKKCEAVGIVRTYPGFWRFVDSGDYTPLYQAENLEEVYRARPPA